VRRREFINLLGGAVAGWPLVAHAQRTASLPTIGWAAGDVTLADIAGPDPINLPARAFLHGLRDLGWIEGRTVKIERRPAEGRPERAQDILAEFIARRVDVIFAGAADWLVNAARDATRTIPIVAILNRDPVSSGLVASLARPGGNLTGLTTTTGRELYDKRHQLLKELVPKIGRIAFLGTSLAWEAYRSGGDAAFVPLVFAAVDRTEDFNQAFAFIQGERVDALLVSHGPALFINIPRIVAFAADRRLPAAYPWREATEAGGLMSYGSSAQGLFRQASGHVDRILKGAKPAEMPIEQPAKFELLINMRSAKALGLEVPATLLARAEEVIE
jgi:putative tryptophan/tyrosine transport system substrate-binding protein